MVRTRVGYCGGSLENPTYHNLGNHTETMQIDFDPSVVTYERLMELYWAGSPCSSGSRQYAAIVFVHDETQRALAEKARAAHPESRVEILPYRKFWIAEDYHQKYYLRSRADLLAEMKRHYPDARALADSTAAARLNGYIAGHGSREQLEREIDRLGLSEDGRKTLRSFVVR